MSLALVAVAALAVVVGCILQRTSGMGTGLVVSPFFAILFGPIDGIILTNCTTVVSAGLLTLTMRGTVDWRRVRGILPGVLFGAVAAALAIRTIDVGVLQIAIGVILAVALLATWKLPETGPFQILKTGFVTGATGGFLNTSVGVAAPALLIHARLTKWPQREFAASLQPIFFTMGLMSLGSKLGLGTGTIDLSELWWFFILIAFCVPTGLAIGARVATVVSPDAAWRVAIVVVALGIVGTLLRGIAHVVG